METVDLLPSQIYFPQDSISNRFSPSGKYHGANIGDVLDQVVNGRIQIDDFIKDITIHKTQLKNGNVYVERWASMNNRSLWVLKELEVTGHTKDKKSFRVGGEIPAKMKTTKNGGECVIIRKKPINGNTCVKAPFWKFYNELVRQSQLEFLKNFITVRIECGYMKEDLSCGPESSDDDEFSEKMVWFGSVSKSFKGEL